jgi:ABC-type multidrug transport system fused ATPase/permease subunit
VENQNEDKNIQDVNEWIEHQYDPGHYLGGNVPPAYKNPANKKALGLLLLIIGLGVGIIYTIIFIIALSEMDEKIGLIVFSIFAYSIFIIQIIGGIRTLSKAYSEEHFKKIKKRIILSSVLIIIMIGIGRMSIEQFKLIKTVEITNTNSFDIEEVQFKKYVYLKDKQIKLECNEDNYGILWEYKVVPNENTKYIITYQYYSFNQKKGTVLKIEIKN